MANRRKFLAGLGALASGSAAAVGTGAFTSVTADRSITAEVAGDASAYLALEPVSSTENSEYVQIEDNKVSFDFSSSNPNTDSSSGTGDLGDGFNKDATTVINNLLKVTNQGTQDVNFTINLLGGIAVGDGFGTFSTDELGGESDLLDNTIEMSPGEEIIIDLTVDGTGANVNSWSGTIQFFASSAETTE